LRPAGLLAAALGGRLRPRLAVGVFASAAAADVVLLAGGVLLTRESTRSAVSRSVSRVATAARSVSRRASRSLIFFFSTPIWSNIVGVVVGVAAFSGIRSIGMINLAGCLTPQCGIFNCRSASRLICLRGRRAAAVPEIAMNKLVLLDKRAFSKSARRLSRCLHHPQTRHGRRPRKRGPST
jgi:hypothetical protein